MFLFEAEEGIGGGQEAGGGGDVYRREEEEGWGEGGGVVRRRGGVPGGQREGRIRIHMWGRLGGEVKSGVKRTEIYACGTRISTDPERTHRELRCRTWRGWSLCTSVGVKVRVKVRVK